MTGIVVGRSRVGDYCRAALVALWLTPLLPAAVRADCWELERTDGGSIRAGAIWQTRNRITDTESLIGTVDGERRAIDLRDVETIDVLPADLSALSPQRQSAARLDVRLAGGQRMQMLSDMQLHYLDGEERRVAALPTLASLRRCADTPAAAAAAGEAPASPPATVAPAATGADVVVVLKNGDLLHGVVTNAELGWQAAYASVTLQPADVLSIENDCDGNGGKLQTRAGDRMSGELTTATLSLRLRSGQTIEVDAGQVRRIDFDGKDAAKDEALGCGG